MKRLLLVLILIYVAKVQAQEVSKAPIDTSAFSKWISIQWAKLSGDGKYAMYLINNMPVYQQTLVIKKLDGLSSKTIIGASSAVFSKDSRSAVYLTGQDTLCLLNLRDFSMKYIDPVYFFQLLTCKGEEWILYRKRTMKDVLFVRRLDDSKEIGLSDVTEYYFNQYGGILVLKKVFERETIKRDSITYVKMVNGSVGRRNPIQEVGRMEDCLFSENGNQMAFIDHDEKNGRKKIYYYRVGADSAECVVDNQTISGDYEIDGLNFFGNGGKQLFFTLRRSDSSINLQVSPPKVDVWNSFDFKLHSQQLKEISVDDRIKKYIYSFDFGRRRIVRLQNDGESVFRLKGFDTIIAVRTHDFIDFLEKNWNRKSPLFKQYLLETTTGNRQEIDPSIDLSSIIKVRMDYFSIYLDSLRRDVHSYDLTHKIDLNLTSSLPIPPIDSDYDEGDEYFKSKPRGLSIEWLSDNGQVFINDKYDIWVLDPTGRTSPINITNSYGRKHQISFRLILDESKCPLKIRNSFVLCAFDNKNKNNGFFRVDPGRKGDPVSLIMTNDLYYTAHRLSLGRPPVKASDAEIYLVEKQNASTSINYFWTRDFKKFISITDVHPERQYNWLKAEILNFVTLDGKAGKTIIYKPENFDPTKKYPVIIHYYEKMTDKINVFHVPQPMYDFIEIPWFVSKGYIVCTPDIHYTIGEPGESALNTVVGLTKHISKYSWIDTSRIGLQGHSFGGFETNYIIAHSNLFAAAQASAGPVDLICYYNSIWDGLNGASRQPCLELGQMRMGTTLWENPESYIRNSPIFFADKVLTPLLIMHNKEDVAVPFTQGLEWYIGLRRLNKKVWMLQYNGEGHSVLNFENRIDLTLRTTEFFNHYLKAAPIAEWMLPGNGLRVR